MKSTISIQNKPLASYTCNTNKINKKSLQLLSSSKLCPWRWHTTCTWKWCPIKGEPTPSRDMLNTVWAMTKTLAIDKCSTFINQFIIHFHFMTTMFMFHFSFHFLSISQFTSMAQNLANHLYETMTHIKHFPLYNR